MKNLLKKTFSILIALAVLLCCVSAFAEETGETESVNLPVFEIGRGISGTISPDSATEIKAHAGRRGQVQFTLKLAEDCDVSVAIDGGGVFLMRADANAPVYTFIKRFEWNEYAVISMTSSRTTGYSLVSEILPEEPAPEEKQEEVPVEEPAPEEKQEETTADAPSPVEEPDAESREETREEQQVPEVNAEEEEQGAPAMEEEKQEESLGEIQEETQEEPVEDSTEESEAPTVETGTETAEIESEQLTGEEDPTNMTEDTETAEQPITEEANPEGQAENSEEDQTENSEEGQQETENTEGPTNSIEIIIAKVLTPEESWNGKVRNNKPTILKLDVAQTRTIHMLVEGKDVCYSVQKSDRITEDAGQVLTDTETNRSITSWTAEAGSYLISIKAGENSFAAKVAVTFMSDEEFEAWGNEQDIIDTKKNTEENIEEVSEDETEVSDITEQDEMTKKEIDQVHESENNEENRPESETERSIDIYLNWDYEYPIVGDTAHFTSKLTGYDDLSYTVQWQVSLDEENWKDYDGATQENLDVVITEELKGAYWRLVIYVEQDNEM